MHLIITDARSARTRSIHLSGVRLVLAGLLLSMGLMLVAALLYHWVFLKGAREGWPVFGSLVKLVVKDEFEERDKFMRANLDAMARRVGDMQARMVQLEAAAAAPTARSSPTVGSAAARGGSASATSHPRRSTP